MINGKEIKKNSQDIKKKAILKEVKRLNRSKVCSNQAVANFFTNPSALLERFNEELNKLEVKHGRLIVAIKKVEECKSEAALFYVSRKNLRENEYGEDFIDDIHLATYKEIAFVATSYLPISLNFEKLSDPCFKSEHESIEKVEILNIVVNVDLTSPISGESVSKTSANTGHMMLSNMSHLVDNLIIPLAALAGKPVKSITYPFESEDSLTEAFNKNIDHLKGKVEIVYQELLTRRENKTLQPRKGYALGGM